MREVEEKLLYNNQELEKSFSVNLDLLCIADLEGNFLKVNREWEYILGYSKEELEKRKFLEFVHPDDISSTLEAIVKLKNQEQVLNFTNRYRCKDGSYKHIEWRSQHYGHLIYASARDISEKVSDCRALEKMLSSSEYFLQLYEKEIDYQKVTNDFLDITGAEFAAFHLYDEDGKCYTTMGLAGDQRLIKKAIKILGLKIEGKKWAHDPVRADKIKDNTITCFSSLQKLTDDKIPKPIVDLMVDIFQLGETIIIKILNNNIMLGDFTFIMAKDKSFNQGSVAEVYTRQLGLVIKQKRTLEKLQESEASLKETQTIARICGWEYNHTHNTLNWTDTVFDMFEINKEELGTSYQAFLNIVYPEDRGKVNEAWATSLKHRSPYEITYRLLMKDGKIKWVNEVCKTVFDEVGQIIKSIGIVQDITERKHSEEKLIILQGDYEKELKDGRERLANIIEGTNVGTWEWLVQTGETVFNERWAEIIGYTLDEISPVTINTWLTFTHPEELKKSEAQLEQVFAREIDYYDVECRMKHKDGSWIWVQGRGKVISWTPEGKPLLMSGTHTDITQRKNLEIILSNENKLLETTLRSVGDGVISTDNKGNIVFLNKVAEYLTGWTQEAAREKPIEEVFHRIDALTQKKSENRIEQLLKNEKLAEVTHQSILISKEGTQRFIEDSAAPIVQENGEISGVVLVFRDCSEKRAKQEEILYLSYRDQLTGLYNRRFYEEELKRLDIKSNLPLTIVLADVNGLKLINDSFGHLLGDELLRKAAEVMTKGCRSSDSVARIGGDEFIILLPKTDAFEANQIIKGIKDQAANEKVGAFEISISFGYQTKHNEEETIQEIFKNAEDYMYRNKLYESSSMRNKTIDLIVNTLYEKSNREMLHSKRVSEMCEAIAVNMDFDQETVNKIKIAGLMHDIGKMGIDEKILNKPERLNNEEWKEIKKHPEIGYRILSSVNEFSEMASYILEHHERWDGKGYPKGLKGEEISLQARIITVADAYDAMVSLRAYSRPLITEDAIAEIRKCSGNQFDPEIAQIFIEKVLA